MTPSTVPTVSSSGTANRTTRAVSRRCVHQSKPAAAAAEAIATSGFGAALRIDGITPLDPAGADRPGHGGRRRATSRSVWPRDRLPAGHCSGRVRRTTIDDVIILIALFMARRTTGQSCAITIVAGQYTGFAAILALSLAAATGLQNRARAVGWTTWLGPDRLRDLGASLKLELKVSGRHVDEPIGPIFGSEVSQS